MEVLLLCSRLVCLCSRPRLLIAQETLSDTEVKVVCFELTLLKELFKEGSGGTHSVLLRLVSDSPEIE